jgi:hypothetical protein
MSVNCEFPCALFVLFSALSNNTTPNTMADPKKAAVELSARGGETFINVCLIQLHPFIFIG